MFRYDFVGLYPKLVNLSHLFFKTVIMELGTMIYLFCLENGLCVYVLVDFYDIARAATSLQHWMDNSLKKKMEVQGCNP